MPSVMAQSVAAMRNHRRGCSASLSLGRRSPTKKKGWIAQGDVQRERQPLVGAHPDANRAQDDRAGEGRLVVELRVKEVIHRASEAKGEEEPRGADRRNDGGAKMDLGTARPYEGKQLHAQVGDHIGDGGGVRRSADRDI